MAGKYTNCSVNSFEVHEKSPHGKLSVNIGTASAVGGSGPDFASGAANVDFKLDEDSEESFAGMAEISAAAKTATPAKLVNITVLSGAKDEIDVLGV
jgi:hypothetical protein